MSHELELLLPLLPPETVCLEREREDVLGARVAVPNSSSPTAVCRGTAPYFLGSCDNIKM